jgi:peroxiredoxin
VIAVVAQRSDKVKRYIEETGLPFNILVDEERTVLQQYGVWHRIGFPVWNIARPALFVIDRAGTIRSIYVGEGQEEFPDAEVIAKEVQTVTGK